MASRFDRRFLHMQGANLVPVRGVGAEIVRRRPAPLLANRLEALQVPGEHRLVAGHQVDDHADQRSRPIRGIGEAEQHPTSFPVALQQPGFAQQLEMPTDARLALPENLRQFLDVELAMREHQQEPQPGLLSRRA
jgi:hypothetical protein